MILTFTHWLLVVLYLLLPVAAVAFVLRFGKRFRGALAAIIISFVAGMFVAAGLNLIYAHLTRGRLLATQLLLSAYFATAMFLLLRLFDAGVRFGLRRGLGLHRDDSTFLRGPRTLLAALGRVVILFAIGLPYVMATVMSYRPKVAPLDDPSRQLGFDFEPVAFKTSDGVRIAGWWIPAQKPTRRALRRDDWGRQTALVCHGLAANKSNQLMLARKLVPAGYNVLAFDFRAHGESGGQLATFGAHERRDVLAAVAWLRAQRPSQAQRIVGVGASMGAAALISAAADRSDPNAAFIDAIACFACYDDLRDMTATVTDQYFAWPMDWLLLNVGLPLAAAQTGADLLHYSPARDAAALWPRPILLIHGEQDEIVDFDRGLSLLRAASQPKYHIFFPAGYHNDILEDDAAARIVIEFFRSARALPVI